MPKSSSSVILLYRSYSVLGVGGSVVWPLASIFPSFLAESTFVGLLGGIEIPPDRGSTLEGFSVVPGGGLVELPADWSLRSSRSFLLSSSRFSVVSIKLNLLRKCLLQKSIWQYLNWAFFSLSKWSDPTSALLQPVDALIIKLSKKKGRQHL